jgi:hypothetical protein
MFNSYSETKSPSTYFKGNKDTSYLIRGSAIQSVFDKWVSESLYLKSMRDQLSWVDYNYGDLVDREHSKNILIGDPKIPLDLIKLEVHKAIIKTLPNLQKFLDSLNYSQPPKSQEEVICRSIADTVLTARADFIFVNSVGESIALEGKSTHSPSKIDESQLLWTTEILADNQTHVAQEHYYLFYQTGEFRVMDREPGKINKFRTERDRNILGILSNNQKATPSSYVCGICPYLRCPWRHILKQRVERIVQPKSSGVRVIGFPD